MSSRTNASSSIAQSRLMELYETTRVVDDGGSQTAMHWKHLNQFAAAIEAEVRAEVPVDMVLHCPACGLQHIDLAARPVAQGDGEARKPLTDVQIEEVALRKEFWFPVSWSSTNQFEWNKFARAIEAVHGITGAAHD